MQVWFSQVCDKTVQTARRHQTSYFSVKEVLRKSLGSVSTYNGDGSRQNLTQKKVNSRSFRLLLPYSVLFNLSNAGYISMRLGLRSILTRWVFLAKTHRSMILKVNQIKIHIYIVLVWTDENVSKWKRWPKISQARAFVACAWRSTYVTTKSSIVFERFSVDSRKRIKTVIWTRVDRCVFDEERKRKLLKTHYCAEGLSSEKKKIKSFSRVHVFTCSSPSR